jgi:hypothetical protein
MPLGTQSPNVYPAEGWLKRRNVDDEGEVVAVENEALLVSIGSQSQLNDAFARMRTSFPFTIFDSKQIADNQPLFYDDQEVSGGGTSSSWDTDRSSTVMAVSATTAGLRVRQTLQCFNYQPGKSQMAIFTFVMGDTDTGITKEVGLFNDENGIFLRNDGGVISLVVRSYVTGSADDTVIPQASWNIDAMDGDGGSGITLDFEAAQIFFLDLEWLGVGSIRFGFFVDGSPYYVHKQNHANSIDSVYMTTPNLPVRYSIENDGTGAVDDFEQICSTVISEGGVQPTGIVRSVDRGVTAITTASNTLVNPVLSIRLKSTHQDISVIPDKVQVFTTANVDFRWSLLLNPTVAGVDAVSWTSLDDSAIEYDVSRDNTNLLTGGVQLDSGYGSSSNQVTIPIEAAIANALKIGADIAGNSDELVLAVQNLAAGTNPYYGSLTFRELL